MPKQQGLSLKELQKGASNVAADAIKNGGNAQAAVDEYYAATGSQPHQQKIQQQKTQQLLQKWQTWAAGDPVKQEFVKATAANMPALLEPGREKEVEIYYQNHLRDKKAEHEKALDYSASASAEDQRLDEVKIRGSNALTVNLVHLRPTIVSGFFYWSLYGFFR